VGLGCTSKAATGEVIALVEKTLENADIAPAAVAALATIDSHAGTAALLEAADHFGVPLRVFTRREIDKEKKRLETPSATVEKATGLAGVCEAVALKAGTLVLAKQVEGNVTCALGKAATPIDVARFGKSAR
jgi:cobalt-precorrin 5A hydrolase/precorrin-3B C17-methyltransferase